MLHVTPMPAVFSFWFLVERGAGEVKKEITEMRMFSFSN